MKKKTWVVLGLLLLGFFSGGMPSKALAETELPADCWKNVNLYNYFNFEFILKFDANKGSKEDVLQLLMTLSDLHRTVLTPEETVLCDSPGPEMYPSDPTSIYLNFQLCARLSNHPNETLTSLEAKANRDIEKFLGLKGTVSLSCRLNQRSGGVTGSN